MSDLARYAEASRNLPLRVIIDQTGKAPTNLKLDSAFDCPFCKGSQSARVYLSEPGWAEWFRCEGKSCRTGNEVLNEIAFISLDRLLSTEAATQVFIKEARIRAQRLQLGDEPLIGKCIEIIRKEQLASISLFQGRLRIGFLRAARVMNILEERGIVGSYQVKPARDILKLPDLRLRAPDIETNSRPAEVTAEPATHRETEFGFVPAKEHPSGDDKIMQTSVSPIHEIKTNSAVIATI